MTGGRFAVQAAVSAQGDWVPLTPLWQVKDLAGFTKEEEEHLLLPLTPLRPRES